MKGMHRGQAPSRSISDATRLHSYSVVCNFYPPSTRILLGIVPRLRCERKMWHCVGKPTPTVTMSSSGDGRTSPTFTPNRRRMKLRGRPNQRWLVSSRMGVSPSAARALSCRAGRAGASAPVVVDRRLSSVVALAAVRAVWQPSGASSWVRPRPDHHHSPVAWLLELAGGSPEVGARVQGGAPGRRRPHPLTATHLAGWSWSSLSSLCGPAPRMGAAARVEDRSRKGPARRGRAPRRVSAGPRRWWCPVSSGSLSVKGQQLFDPPPGPGSAAAASTPNRGRRSRSPGPRSVGRTGGSAGPSCAASRSSSASGTAGTP